MAAIDQCTPLRDADAGRVCTQVPPSPPHVLQMSQVFPEKHRDWFLEPQPMSLK
jgi:hypothetical protein